MDNQETIKHNSGALKIAGLYFFIGVLWILFSDKAVEAIADDQTIQTTISTMKGWGYVLVTAILLYWLIHRHTKSLQERDERVTNIIHAAMDAVISIDNSHRIVLFNPAAEKVFGYTAEEILGLPIDTLIPELYRANHNRQIDDFGQTGITNRHMNGYMEIAAVKKNGEEFPVDISISKIDVEGGKLFTAILRDVTEHKLAQETLQKLHDELEREFQQRTVALSETNALLETMLEYVPDQIYFKDSKSRFIKNSRSQAMAFGLHDPSLVVGKTDFDFFPHAQRSFDEEQAIIRSGKPLVDFEEQVIWPGGEETWVSTTKVPLRNHKGEIMGTFGISRDITDRKRAEESLRKAKDDLEIRVAERTAELSEVNKQLQLELSERRRAEETLRESEERYRTLIEQASDGIFVADPHGNYTDVNSSGCAMLGYTREEILTLTIRDVVEPDELAAHPLRLKELQEEKALLVERKLRRKNGTTFFAELSAKALPDGYYQAIVRDITERKQIEKTLRESESNARSLLNLSRKLEQAQTYSEALGAALDEVKVVIGYQNVWAYLLSEDKRQLRLLTITGEKSQMVTDGFPTLTIKGDRFLEEISEGKDIVLVEDARTDPRTNKDIVAQLGNRTIVNAPIILMDRHLGIFGTGTFGDEGVSIPTSTQLDYLRALASHLAVTLDRIHLLIERKRAEVDLYKSEELLRLGYDTAKLGIWQNIIATGMINFDERARVQYGFELADVPLAEVVTHVHPDDADRLNQAVATTTDPASDGRYGTEYRVVHPDGSIHWLAVQARVYHEGEGNSRHPVSWFGTSQDITERKLTEEKIQQNAARSAALAEVSQALTSVSSDDQAVLDMTTERITRLVGDSCNIRLISKDGQWLEMASLYHPNAEVLPTLRKILDANPQHADEGLAGQVIQSGQPKLIPVVSPEQLKTVLPPSVWPILERISIHSLLIVPLRAEGRTLGTLTVTRDQPGHSYTMEDQTLLQDMADRAALTVANARLYMNVQELNADLEERVAERTAQLEAANKELEAFSYSVSHDLRSPLRGIDGWSLALLEDYGPILDEQAQTHIQRVRVEAQRMGMIIDDILRLSRITRADMNKEQVDLSAIAETVAARLQDTKTEERDVEFNIQKDLITTGDPQLLDVLLTNLLANAFKFTGRKPQAQIEFGQTVIEGEQTFFVRDNGAGFDMTYANKLFGAFQRMHKASEFPGTGIGLATVQRIINRHGGSIWASSEVGQGATFYFTLENHKR